MQLFTDALKVILTRVKMSESKFNSKGTKTDSARKVEFEVTQMLSE